MLLMKTVLLIPEKPMLKIYTAVGGGRSPIDEAYVYNATTIRLETSFISLYLQNEYKVS